MSGLIIPIRMQLGLLSRGFLSKRLGSLDDLQVANRKIRMRNDVPVKVGRLYPCQVCA